MAKRALRILVAEDEPTIRSLIVEVLDDAGFDILEASGGDQALGLLAQPDSVDLVVTDLHMPGPSGVAVAWAARDRHPKIPILFVTARADLLQNVGPPLPYDVLSKPFGLGELRQAVDELALKIPASEHLG